MPEADDEKLRASDVDRGLVASQLRRHAGDGRLTLDELDERLAWAYEAKTIGDLKKLTADLPDLAAEKVELDKPGAAQVIGRDPQRDQGRDQRRQRRHVDRATRHAPHRWASGRALWGSYLSVNLMLIAIWLLSSATSDGSWYPWWVWVAGPWGVVLLTNQIQEWTRGNRSIES